MMRGETVMELWFGNFWRTSRKSLVPDSEKAIIGILAFEISSLMMKVIHLWQCLSNRQMVQLREEIMNSHGIRKLVSDDDDYLLDLALAEIIEIFGCVAKSLARLGKRCADPLYHHLEQIFDDPFDMDLNWRGWEYKSKKMERKVKKMERFIAVTAQLYEELEVLAELEQSLGRMQASVDLSPVKLHDFQQQVMWQRQEVKKLCEMSPWIRTYDYIVRLLLRSLFTIVERIKDVFRIKEMGTVNGSNDSGCVNKDCLVRSHSIYPLMLSSAHPSANKLSKLYSGPIGRSVSNLGLSSVKNRSNNKKSQTRFRASILCGKHPQEKTKRLAHVGPFKGCMMGGSESPVLKSCMPTSSVSLRFSGVFQKDTNKTKDSSTVPFSCCNVSHTKLSLFNLKHRLLSVPSSTLGDAALALHYANVIVLIEKLASSPHLISLNARDDLYNMLPSSVRIYLRAKLKLVAKTLASSVCDAALAADWSLELTRILEWLAPLAHNMIRWHSDRKFEKQGVVSGTKVLLIQTLYFANQAKTEAAIIEILMGLNYMLRFVEK